MIFSLFYNLKRVYVHSKIFFSVNYYLPFPFSDLLLIKIFKVNLLYIFRFSGPVIGVHDLQTYLDTWMIFRRFFICIKIVFHNKVNLKYLFHFPFMHFYSHFYPFYFIIYLLGVRGSFYLFLLHYLLYE